MYGLTKETNIIYLILTASIIFSLILFWYLISIRKFHAKNISLFEQKLNAELFGKEEERKRISKDLHDELGANLSAVKLFIQSIKSTDPNQINYIKKADNILQETLNSIHQITNDLFPAQIDRNGLKASLIDLINKINSSDILYIELLSVPDNIDVYFPQSHKIHIYRVIKEIVQNTLKHSKSKYLLIRFDISENEITIRTEDRGIGFNKSSIEIKQIGNGLINIINRIEAINGIVYYETAPQNGLKYNIKIPIIYES
jgi:signal transduction histidine kinase